MEPSQQICSENNYWFLYVMNLIVYWVNFVIIGALVAYFEDSLLSYLVFILPSSSIFMLGESDLSIRNQSQQSKHQTKDLNRFQVHNLKTQNDSE